jgi:ABC-2 type transport system ATP-binding protein
VSTPGDASTGRRGAGAAPHSAGVGPHSAGAAPDSTVTGTGGGEPVLRVEGLGKRYGSREALHDVSFAAHPGEMVAVIGPNGAGKTTLLSILAGVQAPSTGVVNGAFGEAGGGVGWVPQTPALYPKLSVAENLRLFARLEKVEDPEAIVTRMLQQTGLSDRASERVGRLSGGNRQRVNVALGLLADPAVILLDEPSTALDPAQRERLWQFIAELAAGGTSVVFSTHIVAEAQRYAQRVVVLDEGRLLFDGSPARLAREAGGNEDFELAFVSFLSRQART